MRFGRVIGPTSYGRRDVRLGPADVQALRNALPGLNPALVAGREPASVTHPAGALRACMPDGSWVLLRPSRSRPLARAYAEAPTPAGRDALLAAGAALALSPLSPGPDV